MSILINPHVYLSPPLLRQAFRLLSGLEFSFPARSCSFKRKPGGLKSSPFGLIQFPPREKTLKIQKERVYRGSDFSLPYLIQLCNATCYAGRALSGE